MAGMICMQPIAPAREIACTDPPLSKRMIADNRFSETPKRSAASAMKLRHGSGRTTAEGVLALQAIGAAKTDATAATMLANPRPNVD